MADQLKLLFKSEEMTFTSGMPVIVCGYSLFADRKNGTLFAQLDFISMSEERIVKLVADIECLDRNGMSLEGVKDTTLSELYRNRDQKFGESKLIELPDKSIRSIDVFVKRAEFTDGSYIDAKADAVNITVPVQQRLVDYFDSERYAGQYKRQTNLGAEFVVADLGEKWICSCGAFNDASEDTCHKCTIELAKLKKLLGRDELSAGLKRYDEECKENKKKELKQKEEQKKKAKRTKTLIKLSVTAAVIAAAVVTIWFTIVVPGRSYKKAEDMYYNLQYQQAAEELFKLGGYKDSARFYRYLNEQRLLLRYGIISEYGEDFELSGLRHLREQAIPYNVGLIKAGQGTVGLKTDGTAFAYALDIDVEEWSNIVEISGGFMHAAGLRGDGSVVVAGFDHKVKDWENIISVETGAYHTVGLKTDGSVVAAGTNEFGQCDVEDWRDIAAIYTGNYATFGLKTDGTVFAAGQNKYGELDLDSWEDISDLFIYGNTVVGLKTDGSVVAAGENNMGQCDVQGWSDIISIAVGDGFTVGLKADGSVVAVGTNKFGQCDVQDWGDIVMITAGRLHVLGLKRDGSVVAAGSNEYGQCGFEDQDSVIFIDAGELHTVVLLSDGKVIAAGRQDRGECDVYGMYLW